MMSSTKVVRLEEIEGENSHAFDHDKPNLHVSPVKKTYLPGQEDFINATFDEALVERVQSESVNDVENDIESVQSEEKDIVYPLPENWPAISQLFRRRSCELVKSTLPCVQKAVSHLELIQNIIEEWFKEKEREIETQTPLRSCGSRKHLRFARSSESAKITASSKSLCSAPSSASTSSSLSIRGIGTKQEEEPAEEDVPYLGAEEVIEEVITLLARLESDRLSCFNRLKEERDRAVRLNDKIDKLCLKRMMEMPSVVQQEHEACIMDLNELQWHVAYAVRNQKRIQNRTNIAEVLNNRLKDDIVFVNKHIPLVEEKLMLELEAMDKIKLAQTETVTELDTTTQRQEKTASKSNEAQQKASTERTHIKHELDTVKDALSSISEELAEAKMCYNSYVHQVNELRQQIKDNDEELKVLEVRNENAKVAEEMQAKKVRHLQTRIAEAEFEHQRLENENIKFDQELSSIKRINEDKIFQLEHSVKKYDSQLRQILQKNKEMQMEVEDLQMKITDCEKQKEADKKNVARIQKEMLKLQGQMTVTMEEHNKVHTINNDIRDTLNADQDKKFRMEESLKATVETLRRQVKDEVHTRTVLVARISSDSTELTKAQGETKQKKEKPPPPSPSPSPSPIPPPVEQLPVKKFADEVLGAVNEVKTKVEKLRSAKVERQKKHKQQLEQVFESEIDYSEIFKANAEKKSAINTKLEETKKQHEESQETFNVKIKDIEPRHSALKKDVLALDKRLDHMSWKTEVMNKQMDDMDREQSTMDRLINNTTKAAGELTENLDELSLQLAAGQKIDDDLRADLDSHIERMKNNEMSHRKFMEDREKFKKQSDMEKSNKLQENRELASQYRRMQNQYLIVKEKLLNSFEDRVKLEGAIKDCRQLQSLQNRMHGAMLEYFKYRGMYNRSELRRMEGETHDNGVKVAQLQDQMEDALKNITDFIRTQMDGWTARRVAWEKMKQEKESTDSQSTPSSGSKVRTSFGSARPVIPPIGRHETLAQA